MAIAKERGMGVEDLGGLCLDHLAQDPELLGRFMAEAGYDPARLRSAVGSRDLAAGLIDWFATNEPAMLALCAANRLKPDDFMRVWHRFNAAG